MKGLIFLVVALLSGFAGNLLASSSVRDAGVAARDRARSSRSAFVSTLTLYDKAFKPGTYTDEALDPSKRKYISLCSQTKTLNPSQIDYCAEVVKNAFPTLITLASDSNRIEIDFVDGLVAYTQREQDVPKDGVRTSRPADAGVRTLWAQNGGKIADQIVFNNKTVLNHDPEQFLRFMVQEFMHWTHLNGNLIHDYEYYGEGQARILGDDLLHAIADGFVDYAARNFLLGAQFMTLDFFTCGYYTPNAPGEKPTLKFAWESFGERVPADPMSVDPNNYRTGYNGKNQFAQVHLTDLGTKEPLVLKLMVRDANSCDARAYRMSSLSVYGYPMDAEGKRIEKRLNVTEKAGVNIMCPATPQKDRLIEVSYGHNLFRCMYQRTDTYAIKFLPPRENDFGETQRHQEKLRALLNEMDPILKEDDAASDIMELEAALEVGRSSPR